ncbi:MAG: biotin/lipoyl-binding protein, partial [Muribaculaceae bacterium]|nr:biotin/lipoyl-binding protein [Muribaculaceae bacterium]
MVAACSNSGGDSGVLSHSVYICNPEPVDGSSSLTFPGVVKENENVSLGFKTAGQIKRIFVKEGDHVRSGQLLAELDADDYKLGVEA